MEIIFLLALILINGYFSMSEVALLTARRSRLNKLADEGDTPAKIAVKLGETPTRFLSTIQIGITSIGILTGIMSESVLSEPLAIRFANYGLSPEWAKISSTAIVAVVLTYFSIVVGELVPKRLGQNHPEKVARFVAHSISLLTFITRPFVRLLTLTTDTILRLLPGNQSRIESGVTEEEIHAMLEEGSVSGVIEHQEHQMVRNVFRLDDRQIASLMVPRADMVCLDLKFSLQENLQLVSTSDHSRFPVCRGGLDDVLGIVSAKQLLNLNLRGQEHNFADQLQPAVFVPETLTGMELLEHFRDSGSQMVIAVDEYGSVQGLVTLQDVLEAVTGEFTPRNKEDAWAMRREDGTWLLDGLIPIPDLKDTLDVKNVPNEDSFHTLSGLVMFELGRLPNTGDIIELDNWRLEVIDMDGKRIDKILAIKKPDSPIEPETQKG